LATLAASPAIAAKVGQVAGLPGATAAYASPGAEADSPPGALQQKGTPVRLHSAAAAATLSKTAGKSARSVHGRHGAKLAAASGADTPAKPAAKGKSKKKLASSVRAAHPMDKTKNKTKPAPQ
jgi:hypothetical protein